MKQFKQTTMIDSEDKVRVYYTLSHLFREAIEVSEYLGMCERVYMNSDMQIEELNNLSELVNKIEENINEIKPIWQQLLSGYSK